MPKNLTERQCRHLPEGVHRAAPSLYVSVRGGSRLWLVRYTLQGKARTMSLGSVHDLPLEAAIAAASTARAKVRLDGVDVVAERRATRAEQAAERIAARALEPAPMKKVGHTFGELLDVAVQAEARAKNWKPHPTACARWLAPIKRYCAPLISKDVTQITEAALVEVLAVPWVESHLSATRALLRTITVMGHARRLGWIAGDHALVVARIQERLPAMPKGKSRHHPALPLRAVPGFVTSLAADDEVMSDLFRFLILSGVRCAEAAGARWSEIDLAERLWTIPGGTSSSRLKRWQSGDFRVPIGDGMAAILGARQNAHTDDEGLVFPAPKNRPFDANQLMALLIKKGYPRGTATVHGFRSALRGFLAEHCEGEYAAKEMCLHHETRTDTAQAYDRGDFLRERRGMMAAWDMYCAGKVSIAASAAVVLPLRHAVAA